MSGTSLAAFGQYGVLGVLAAVLGVFARGAYTRETKRADDADAEVRRLNGVILEMASRSSTALAQSAASLREATQVIHRLQDRDS